MPDTPELIEITIVRLGGLGDGMAMHDGLPLIVPKSCAGDRISVEIIQRQRERSVGRIATLIEPGPARATPPCPHYAACGGCSLQHLTPDAYRTFKLGTLQEAVRKSGFLLSEDALALHLLPPATRRRVTLHCTDGGELAYHAPHSHALVPIRVCPIMLPALQSWLPSLQAALIPPYPISLQLTVLDGGIDASLHFDGPENTMLCTQTAALTGIVRLQTESASGRRTVVDHGMARLTIGNYTVAVPPGAFLQATAEGQALISAALAEAVRGHRRMLELFCGLGSYTLTLADDHAITACDSDAALIDALRGSAAPVTANVRDLFRRPYTTRELRDFDAVILNPPRAGAKTQCEQLASSDVSLIAMVSCNPATFARDAAILRQGGWRLQSLTGIDQFVWSAHLELVAIFRKS